MKRHIFKLYALILAVLVFVPYAYASSLYEVQGVKVDVTADNALQARSKAFEVAQTKAFDVLSQQMFSQDQIQSVKKPDLKLISRMIQDFEVTEEKLSDVRYIGTYNFRFNENNVNQYFNMQGADVGVQYTNIGSKPVLVLPFFQGKRDTWLWDNQNFWRSAWSSHSNLGGAVPLRIPVGDLDDMQDVKDRDLFDYDQGRLDRMLSRYGSREAILVVGSADEAFLSVQNNGDIAQGRFTAHIYRTDRRGPEYVSNIVVQARAPETRRQMLSRAVKKVHRELQQDWKTKTATAPQANRKSIIANTNFNSLQEWARMQKKLESLSGVDIVNVKSISPARAQIELIYRGSQERLALVLDQARLTLNQSGDGAYNLIAR